METNNINDSWILKLFRMKWLIGFAALLLLMVLITLKMEKLDQSGLVKSDYQAVFLVNNQVYFGKLELKGHWIVLRDIYYLQREGELQQGQADANAQPNSQLGLVKLGSELHGPQDEMYIDRDKVLFWENLKDDSKVVQTIKSR